MVDEFLLKVNVLVVGLDSAGKTSTIRGILKAPPRDLGPTSGCVRTQLRVDNFVVTLLDVGGGGESRGAWRQLCGEAHGLVFVVDSSDGQRVTEARGLLTDVLQHPRVARKPLLLLANKQDKMDALPVSDLMEALSLEQLVNQSRSPCHIEPSSALVDARRWTDRKTLRGLRWLLRAVSLDYADLCARITRDSKRPAEQEKRERTHTSKKDLQHGKDLPGKEKKMAKKSTGGKLHPIQNILKAERSLKRNMKEKQVKIRDAVNSRRTARSEGGEEEEGEVKGRTEIGQRGGTEETSSSALVPRMRGKTERKMKIMMKDTLVLPESEKNEEPSAKKGEVESKKKKKSVNVKKKNKINSEGAPAAYSQPVDLSATFDLYRKAILALKARPEQNKGGSSC